MDERRTVTLQDVSGKDALTIERFVERDNDTLAVRFTQHGIRRPLIPLSELTLAERALTSDLDRAPE